MDHLITLHDTFNVHKILGFGCLAHYGIRFYWKFRYGSMFLNNTAITTYLSPLAHLTLSLSSFMFSIPTYRFNSKVIIWRELQLHNIIFTSRSVCMMYHAMLFQETNPLYYYSRLGIVLFHHYAADFVSGLYQPDNKTTTRDIPYDNKLWFSPYLYKKYYAISQMVATCNILLSKNAENGFAIMFPIQLSAFLMTLVRKNIITNNDWHLYYTLSLALPYLLNFNGITPINNQFYAGIAFVIARLGLGIDKYVNMFLVTSMYNYITK